MTAGERACSREIDDGDGCRNVVTRRRCWRFNPSHGAIVTLNPTSDRLAAKGRPTVIRYLLPLHDECPYRHGYFAA